jgi:Holliday junction resolvase RusA-like endonuclease
MVECDVQLPLIAEAAPLHVSRETFVAFELPGPPRAWERAGARIARNKDGQQYIVFYVGTEEQLYRNALALTAKAALRGRSATQLPVAVLIHAFMPIPASWTARERMDARAGAEVPAATPDADNIGKLVGDALKEIIWMDDAQIVDLRVIKRYSETPALRVEVREFVSA